MRKIAFVAFVAALITSFGCAVVNYPVIFDSRGGDDNQILDSFYDKAYIVPTSQVATIYADGTDELFTLVSQDWRGDQWLYTYNNFDSSGAVVYLDQQYCDPTRQTDCAIVTAWNPDLPEAYAFGSSPINEQDDPLDGTVDDSCSGARSLSMMVSNDLRLGECGSGVFSNRQAAMAEFEQLDVTTFQGKEYYALPIDSRSTSVRINAHQDGAVSLMPIYGRFNGFLDDQFRMAIQATPNAKYQTKWLQNWTASHGSWNELEFTYNGLAASFNVNLVMTNADRL